MARRPKREPAARRAATAGARGRGPRALEGTVLPLELGQEGVVVRADGTDERLTLPAGVPGDRVRVVRGTATLERLLAPSPARITPPCPLLERCGGCSLQAMDYRAQLAQKTDALRRALAGLGLAADRVRDVVGLERPFGQRTKLLMAAGGRAGALRLGFYRRGTTELVAAEGCPVQHPRSLALLASARQLLDAYHVRPSTSREGGWLHALGVRVDPRGGESELALSGASPRLPAELVQQLARLPSVSGVHLAVSRARTSYPMEGPLRTLAGRPRTAFTLGGERYLLSPGTFFQTCAEGAERLLETVRELLPESVNLLADLYAGAGLLALGCRSRWRRAVAVEANPAAVADLRRRLEHEDERGLSVLEGRVEDRIGEVLRRGPDVALLDPPRRGCAPGVIAALRAHGPPVLLYVACGFEALARDGHALLDGGYRLEAAAAVDMFPHTPHLEVIVRLGRGA